MLLDTFIEAALNLEVFDDGLDYQVAVFEFPEVIVKVTDADKRSVIRREECGGPCLLRCLEPSASDTITNFLRLQRQAFRLFFVC
jgi:hypothetical protein